mmetsp:Transcript_31301/g.82040  ORF Transcript_31301/g.82040 Transcript_31301/m.82040 type:complete len:502 (+) Transcript_31301:68-1573(+)
MAHISRFQLDDSSLKRDPEDIFDLLDKLGQGAFGSVHKAMHKETKHMVAIKQIPLDTDLIEIIREIKVLGENDHPNVVRYYGSYLKDSNLWIIMEYCGAGSCADVIRFRQQPFSEPQIATIFAGVVCGLAYLHSKKTIHRDVKAGNILMTTEGVAKLADFGVAGQLSSGDNARRNTVIGTPYWMAPEVIDEDGYDMRADLWSLGITAIEMAEGSPPHSEVHPMRAMFMIPTSPPPKLKVPDEWSEDFRNFIDLCLVKDPQQRAHAAVLAKQPFVIKAGEPSKVLAELVDEVATIMENPQLREAAESGHDTTTSTMLAADTVVAQSRSGSQAFAAVGDAGTVVFGGAGGDDSGTMVVNAAGSGTMMVNEPDTGTMVVNDGSSGTMVVNDGPSGTMVHNEGTVKAGGGGSPAQPAFMQYFADKEAEAGGAAAAAPSAAAAAAAATSTASPARPPLSAMSIEDLRKRLEELEPEKQREIEALRKRYQAKRRPIEEALKSKQKAT